MPDITHFFQKKSINVKLKFDAQKNSMRHRVFFGSAYKICEILLLFLSHFIESLMSSFVTAERTFKEYIQKLFWCHISSAGGWCCIGGHL